MALPFGWTRDHRHLALVGTPVFLSLAALRPLTLLLLELLERIEFGGRFAASLTGFAAFHCAIRALRARDGAATGNTRVSDTAVGLRGRRVSVISNDSRDEFELLRDGGQPPPTGPHSESAIRAISSASRHASSSAASSPSMARRSDSSCNAISSARRSVGGR